MQSFFHGESIKKKERGMGNEQFTSKSNQVAGLLLSLVILIKIIHQKIAGRKRFV